MSDIDDLFETLTNLQRSKQLPLHQPGMLASLIFVLIERVFGITRHSYRAAALVDLFATILRCEKDDYYLVTPAEKMRIVVEEAPLSRLIWTSEWVRPNKCFSAPTWVTSLSPIRTPDCHARRAPFCSRDRLEARIQRSVFYRLVEEGEQRGDDL